ncbi:MAG: ABC transporter ATP-binding protein [Bacillota bacterium]|jgi:ABC-2 type transport system ATP-binding protein
MLLEFQRVSFSYSDPHVLALDNVSFRLQRGEIVGLIGANGAGKSTAILNAIGYVRPQEGSIRVNGQDISRFKGEDFPVSYIPDEPIFYEELTLLEHLHFLKALYPNNKVSIEKIIDVLELHGHLHKVPAALSRGTKQKLMIALSLLREFELLIADEPFTGLDPKQISVFKQILRECRKSQMAVLLSTHLLDVVDGLCDRYVVLHQGRVMANGTKQEIIQSHSLSLDSTLEKVYLWLVGGPS